MKKVKIKAIKMNADFRKSEMTNYDNLRKSKRFPGPLSPGEAYLLVSRSGNQMIWILGVNKIADSRNKSRELIDSRRWRLRRGTWSYHMLENYANAVGLSLGSKRLEEEFSKS